MIVLFSVRRFGKSLTSCLCRTAYTNCKNLDRIQRSMQPKLGELKTMKLDSDQFRSILTPELKIIEELFKKNGHEIRIAGGAVRDLVMGIIPHDIDFASTATPSQMKQMFNDEQIRMINAGGEKHGTITARINDKENFEITTLRIDVVTDGRHAEVEFTTDWQLDANRRDLTINAMFLSFDGMIYDYFKGIEHIEQRRVLFVGDATTRIKEDYLRILRYFRFYGRIAVEGSSHDAATLEAIQLNADGLANIAGERLLTELSKILEGNFAKELMCLMIELGVTPFLGLPQKSNVDEFKRVCDRTRSMVSVSPMTKIAALLEDEKEVLQLHDRLKLSTNNKNLLRFIVLMRPELEKVPQQNWLADICQATMITGNMAEIKNTRQCVEELMKYTGDAETLEKFQQWEEPKFPLNGYKLSQAGCPKGILMGSALKKLRKIWLDSGFVLTENELLERAMDDKMWDPSKVRKSKSSTPGGDSNPNK